MEQKELVMEGGVVGIGINLVCCHYLRCNTSVSFTTGTSEIHLWQHF